MTTVRRAFIDNVYGQLHYRYAFPERPTARPLICFHLSPGSGRMYAPLLAAMATDRIALAPDTPGFGESDPPPAPPTIAEYAEAMHTFLDALGLQEVDALGYHTGSKIALELGLQRPDRVRRLVLIGAPVYTSDELARQRQTMGNPEPLHEDGAHLLRGWRGLYDWRGPDQTLVMLQQEFAESLRGGPVAWYGHHAAFAYAHADHLPQAMQPILILCPDDDLVTPTQRAEALLKPERGSRFLRLPGWGHGMLTVRTAEVAAILRSFLDESLPPTPG